MKSISLFLSFLLIFNFLVTVTSAAEGEMIESNVMATFYVSPEGSDEASGTLEAPFATLEKAKAEVAKINDDMTGDIVVYLMDGVYELDETIRFNKEDSGSNGYNIRYEAAPGAHPVISGGTELDNDLWEYHDTVSGYDIYKMPLSRDRKLRALYVNGERSYMASTEDAVNAQGTWGTYTIGDTKLIDQFDWSPLYSDDFDSREIGRIGTDDSDIKLFSKNGDLNDTVVNVVYGEGSNHVLQLASTETGDNGFEILNSTYKNGLISFKIKLGDDHEFSHEWEALALIGANVKVEDATEWAGIKFAPQNSGDEVYYQTGTDGDGTSPQNIKTMSFVNDQWYQVKMMVTEDGEYYSKYWADGSAEPDDWSRQDNFTNVKGQDLFFRMFAYKHQAATNINILLDDLTILSGTKKSEDMISLPDWAWETGSKADGILYNQTDFPFIESNIEDVEIENQQIWNKNIVTVREMEAGPDGKWIMKLQQPYGAIAQTPGWGVGLSGSGEHKIWNAYEFLDHPGEFFFDRENQMLYYIPRSDEDLTTASVVVPRLETLVDFRGTPEVSGDLTTAGEKTITGQTKNIVFQGVTFAHSDWGLQKVGDSYGKSTVQASTVYTAYSTDNWHFDMYRNLDTLPGAINIEFAHNIKILDGEIKLTGAEGVLISNDVDGNEVSGNFIYQTGGSGVTVGNPHHIYENDSLEPEVYVHHEDMDPSKPIEGATADKEKYQNGTERVPRDVTISDNVFLDNCRLFPSHSPITAYFTRRLVVSNNYIKNAAYTAISVGWGWPNFDGTPEGFLDWGTKNNQGGSVLPGYPTEVSGDNKIINNRIEDSMTILHDGGMIYTLGQQVDTEISGNYGRGSESGIYTDEGSAYFKPIENNVIADVNRVSIRAGEYGRKHDLHFINNYSNTDEIAIAGKASINITNTDYHYIPDKIWPKEAMEIIQQSGLSTEYRVHFADVLHEIYGSVQDALLPQSATLDTLDGDTLLLNAWLEEDDEIWLAPADTTEFIESTKMTKAPGNAAEISLPSSSGDYRLYVKQDGHFSGASLASISVKGTVSPVEATPAAGTYTKEQNVVLSVPNDGASIYYTLDGTEPSTSSTLYTAPILIDEPAVIKAIAIKDGHHDSEIKEFVYTIQEPAVTTVELELVPDILQIPDSGTVTSQASTIVKDQLGNVMENQPIVYSIPEITGVTINPETGVITVSPSALEVEVLVTAQSGSVTGAATLKLVAAELPTLDSIQIVTLPTKLVYESGDKLDLKGISVVAVYSDSSEEHLLIEDLIVSGFDSSTTGKKQITLMYQDKSTIFEVNVKEKNKPTPKSDEDDDNKENVTEDEVEENVTDENGVEQTEPSESPESEMSKVELSDITNHWAHQSIEKSVELGFVQGFGDGTFKPNQMVTRGELATMLARAIDLDLSETEIEFVDKGETPDWAQPYIQGLINAGFVSGYDDGTFRAQKQITRAELTVMLLRVLGVQVDSDAHLTFKDSDQVPDWAKAYVSVSVELGIINGYPDGTFRPNDFATRAEAVTMILTILNKIDENKAEVTE